MRMGSALMCFSVGWGKAALLGRVPTTYGAVYIIH